MGNEAKTRFLISVDGRDRELVSVTEMRNSKSLTFTPKRGLQVGDETLGPYIDVVGQHFSVHTSPKSPGYTIAQTIEFADTRERRTSALVLPEDGFFIWPIYGLVSPDLRADHYLATPRAKDDCVELGAFDPGFGTLVYFVVVTTKPTTVLVPPFGPFKLSVREFTRFDVLVFHTFMYTPSTQQGGFTAFVTSSRTWGRAAPDYKIEGGGFTVTPSGLQACLRAALGRLARGQFERVLQAHPQDGSLMTPELRQMYEESFSIYCPIPFEENFGAPRG